MQRIEQRAEAGANQPLKARHEDRRSAVWCALLAASLVAVLIVYKLFF